MNDDSVHGGEYEVSVSRRVSERLAVLRGISRRRGDLPRFMAAMREMERRLRVSLRSIPGQ